MFTKNALACGDSIMAGVSLTNGRYKKGNSNWLHSIGASHNVSINNIARFGLTTPKAYKVLEDHLENESNYSICILELGGNDCNFNWAAISRTPHENHDPETTLDKFVSSYQAIIDLLKKYNIEPIIVTLPPIEPFKYFSFFTKDISGESVLVWLKDVYAIYRYQELYNNKLLELAQMNNLRVIRLREALLDIKNYKDLLCPDGLHLNEYGYLRVTDILKEIQPK